MLDPAPAGQMLVETLASALGAHVLRNHSNLESASVTLPPTQPPATHRFAQTRCAKHLEKTLAGRKALAKSVTAFYSTASQHAHGRKVAAKHREKHEQHLRDARHIMRRSLLKIVGSEGCADPDLDALSLG